MPSENEGTRADDLEACVGHRIEFPRRRQLPSSEFKVFMSPDLSLQHDCVVDSSPFPAASIPYSVGFDDSDGADDVLNKALSLLLNLRGCYR